VDILDSVSSMLPWECEKINACHAILSGQIARRINRPESYWGEWLLSKRDALYLKKVALPVYVDVRLDRVLDRSSLSVTLLVYHKRLVCLDSHEILIHSNLAHVAVTFNAHSWASREVLDEYICDILPPGVRALHMGTAAERLESRRRTM
jgi:hypothetical protein